MIESPYRYEEWLTAAEFQKLGELFLRWSHTEHIIGNCLRVILGLDEDDAIAIIFPMPLERRLDKIKEITDKKPLSAEAEIAFQELNPAMKCINYVRNCMAHTIILDDPKRGLLFHLRSHERYLSKDEVLSTEELTNYAAHAALSLRYALGFKGDPGERHPLPDRPEIPEFLRSKYQVPKTRNVAIPRSRPGSSQG